MSIWYLDWVEGHSVTFMIPSISSCNLGHSNFFFMLTDVECLFFTIVFQLFGETAIIHFITVVCHCGLCRITDVHCANKNGLYRRLAGNAQLQVGKYLSLTQNLSIC